MGKKNKKKEREKNAERTKGKKKNRKRKKSRRNGKLRQGESDGSDVRTRQVWPWMASIVFNSSFICAGHSVSPRIVVTSTRCFPSLFWAKGEDNPSRKQNNGRKNPIKRK